ncbi:MAG: zf-HC2 domain-containing protein, partial [Candidatus Zixiibacteriota bacterium]
MPECIDRGIGSLLHAYELRALPDEDSERFEIHLMKCEHCFAKVKAFEKYAVSMHSSDAVKALTERAAADSRPDTVFRGGFRTWLWPDVHVLLRPGLIYLIVLLMIVPAFNGLRYLTGGTAEVRPVQKIVINDLRESSNIFRISSGLDGLINIVLTRETLAESYDIVISSGDGKEIAHYDDFRGFKDLGA